MSQIEYIEGDQTLLDQIAPLWEQLKQYHASVSTYFTDAYTDFTFDMRQKQLTEKSGDGQLRVVLARDRDRSEYVGYCVATITPDGVGEVDSLYVDNSYRGQDIGTRLTETVLNWFERNKVSSRLILVAYGNDRVLEFYRRFGFYPRSYILKEPPKKSDG